MQKSLAAVLGISLVGVAPSALSATAYLPRGTVIYAELGERVTSNSRKYRVGYEPLAHVWKDVQINGVTIIEAGTPVGVRISRLAPRGVGGRGASIQISATQLEVGDEVISLSGGYGEDTRDRTGLTRALGMVFWPGAFLPGKRAALEEGMVFDMEIRTDTYIEIPDSLIPTVNLAPPSGLNISVVYDELTEESNELPLEIRLCGQDWTNDIFVGSVNDKPIDPIDVEMRSRIFSNNCDIAHMYVDLEALSEHFERGINRFTVSLGELTEEVLLNVEM